MTIAWFRSTARAAADAVAPDAVLAGLAAAHAIEPFDERSAHDFVWKHARQPYDLCVYELGDVADSDFVRAYLFHYPGVLVALDSIGDPYATAASRLVLVSDEATAEVVQHHWPSAIVRTIPVGVTPFGTAESAVGPDVRFAVIDDAQRELFSRALARARAAGAAATIAHSLADADVIVATHWPPAAAAMVDAARAMSTGKPVIVLETDATAGWPTLDPQTWQRRGYGDTRPPLAVSIDPRDDEHSLVLAIRRLCVDGALRATLGAAAEAWWREHATVEQAVVAWDQVLREALLIPAPRPANLPPALSADGTGRARELLAPFGVEVDFLAGSTSHRKPG